MLAKRKEKHQKLR
jgi:hypothetical protein